MVQDFHVPLLRANPLARSDFNATPSALRLLAASVEETQRPVSVVVRPPVSIVHSTECLDLHPSRVFPPLSGACKSDGLIIWTILPSGCFLATKPLCDCSSLLRSLALSYHGFLFFRHRLLVGGRVLPLRASLLTES